MKGSTKVDKDHVVFHYIFFDSFHANMISAYLLLQADKVAFLRLQHTIRMMVVLRMQNVILKFSSKQQVSSNFNSQVLTCYRTLEGSPYKWVLNRMHIANSVQNGHFSETFLSLLILMFFSINPKSL